MERGIVKNPGLMCMLGAYMLYLAYGLVQDIISGVTEQSRLLLIGAGAVLFAVCGVVFFYIAFKEYRNRRLEDSEASAQDEE